MFAPLKKYAQFTGRSSRKEYWMFFLFTFGVSLILSFISPSLGMLGAIIHLIFALGIIVPSLAVAVRRLHDIGKSGWWIFISLVPLIGGIWFIVLMASNSQDGPNEYGPHPDSPGGAGGADDVLDIEETF